MLKTTKLYELLFERKVRKLLDSTSRFKFSIVSGNTKSEKKFSIYTHTKYTILNYRFFRKSHFFSKNRCEHLVFLNKLNSSTDFAEKAIKEAENREMRTLYKRFTSSRSLHYCFSPSCYGGF